MFIIAFPARLPLFCISTRVSCTPRDLDISSKQHGRTNILDSPASFLPHFMDDVSSESASLIHTSIIHL